MRSSLALILAFWVSACSLLPEQIDETKNWSAQKLYSAAKDKLDASQFEAAIKLYEKLEARYPYGRFAQQAQLEVAYAYYKDREIASAVSAAERVREAFQNCGIEVDDAPVVTTVSIGVAGGPAHIELDVLLAAAEEKLS